MNSIPPPHFGLPIIKPRYLREMKAGSKFYKGIEYIVTSDLPEAQRHALKAAGIETIKIMMDGKVVENCVTYQQYAEWYHTKFFVERAAAEKRQKNLSSEKVFIKKS